MVVKMFNKTFRPELYLKLESWVNKFGGDRAFANRISETPKTIQFLISSTPELMKRFGFSTVPISHGEQFNE